MLGLVGLKIFYLSFPFLLLSFSPFCLYILTTFFVSISIFLLVLLHDNVIYMVQAYTHQDTPWSQSRIICQFYAWMSCMFSYPFHIHFLFKGVTMMTLAMRIMAMRIWHPSWTWRSDDKAMHFFLFFSWKNLFLCLLSCLEKKEKKNRILWPHSLNFTRKKLSNTHIYTGSLSWSVYKNIVENWMQRNENRKIALCIQGCKGWWKTNLLFAFKEWVFFQEVLRACYCSSSSYLSVRNNIYYSLAC